MEKDIIQLKVDMGEVKRDVAHIKEGHKDLKKSVDDGFEDLGKKIDGLDKKFSAKWVEKCMVWAARIVGGAMIVGLITLIVRAALYFFK